VVELARKVLLVGVIVFILPETPTQLAVGVVMSLLSIVLYAKYQPYVEEDDDLLQLFCQLAIFFSFLGAMLLIFKDTEVEGFNLATSTTFPLIIVGCNVVPMLAGLFLVLRVGVWPIVQMAWLMMRQKKALGAQAMADAEIEVVDDFVYMGSAPGGGGLAGKGGLPAGASFRMGADQPNPLLAHAPDIAARGAAKSRAAARSVAGGPMPPPPADAPPPPMPRLPTKPSWKKGKRRSQSAALARERAEAKRDAAGAEAEAEAEQRQQPEAAAAAAAQGVKAKLQQQRAAAAVAKQAAAMRQDSTRRQSATASEAAQGATRRMSATDLLGKMKSGGGGSLLDAARQFSSRALDASAGGHGAAPAFAAGAAVSLTGLRSAPQLNGTAGTVQSGPVPGTGRFQVLCAHDGRVRALKPDNLASGAAAAVGGGGGAGAQEAEEGTAERVSRVRAAIKKQMTEKQLGLPPQEAPQSERL
jgi:hypothetical protein